MTTKRIKRARTSDYKGFLAKQLTNPKLAAGYLTESFLAGEEVFLLAIKDVVEARGGISALAKLTALNREGLYDMLSANGNPRLTSLAKVLDALGMTIAISPRNERKKAA